MRLLDLLDFGFYLYRRVAPSLHDSGAGVRSVLVKLFAPELRNAF